jgi:hypothetical protein
LARLRKTVSFADRDYVVKHECIHDEILIKTPFGNLQFICQRLEAAAAGLIGPRREVANVLDYLIDVSRDAHEAAATYLSVTAQPAFNQAEVLQRHPDKYKSYFNALAEPVTAVCGSTFVGYLVGRAIVDIVFSPPLADLVERWSHGVALILREQDKPDFRLSRLAALIIRDASAIREELLTQANQAVRHHRRKSLLPRDAERYWNSDDWWETVPHAACIELEKILAAVAFKALRERSTELFSTLAPGDWSAEAERYAMAAHAIDKGIDLKISGISSVLSRKYCGITVAV